MLIRKYHFYFSVAHILQFHILFTNLCIFCITSIVLTVFIPHVQLVFRLQYVEHIFEEGVLFEKYTIVTYEVECIAACIAYIGFQQDTRNGRRKVASHDGVCVGVLGAIGRGSQCG